jgi:hypothetical protein
LLLPHDSAILREKKFEQERSLRLQKEILKARFAGKCNDGEPLHFSTFWVEGLFTKDGFTQAMLVIFPFPIPKKGEERKKLEKEFQHGFKKVYLS